ncbi:MAG: hypothetical protein P4L92_23005 [Rudaea sp.]|nr:hypothetical protein [Rudaea sp.]
MIAGCASSPAKDANYAAYLDLVAKQAQDAADQRTAFATMAAKCTSDACVTQVAAIAALSGANATHAPPQQFVPQESIAAKFGLALVSQISPLAAAAVSWHAQDTSRDVSLAQFGYLGQVTHDITGTATALGTAAAGAAPTISVGRDYITGTVDNGTHVGGNQIGHDAITNSGRYYSPSADPSASGDGCAGATTCQTPTTNTTTAPGG